ncbi:MAG: Fe-S cluster assembly protein SufD [Verrucomicrobiota bacterium]
MIQTAKPVVRPSGGYWEKFDQFQQSLSSREPAWLTTLRKSGLARFAETGFPTTADEDWRFTNVGPIAKLPLHPLSNRTSHGVDQAWLNGLPFDDLKGVRLVFVDGHFAPALSRQEAAADGTLLLNLAAALESESALIERHLGRQAHSANNAFVALNTAFFTDGALIYVPDGRAIEEPVHILHIASADSPGATAHLRHLVVAGANSKVTLVEQYATRSGAAGVTNAVTELVVSDGAKVEHCKLQDESCDHYHLATIHADLSRQADFTAHSFALGSRLSRNNIRTLLGGEGVECVLNGLYLTKDDQLADHHMIVEHAKPHCNSHEYFNGILDGHSRGVFHGRILVRQDAQKTDAKQTNKNLLLSDDAGVNTKPQLEIYADDVKCTHGATIGQLNDESIFYLRARGIGYETARRMLMHSFAGEIIDRIRCEGVRERLDRLVWDRLEQNRQISVAR